jgi:hypothetical protein
MRFVESRRRAALIGTGAVLVALIATAFAVGGGSDTESAGAARSTASLPLVASALPTNGRSAASDGLDYSAGKSAPRGGVPGALPAPEVAPAHGAVLAPGAPSRVIKASDASSVDATRIVKTGNLTIRVAKKDVQAVTQSLTELAATQGGYVAQSNTNFDSATPSGQVVLRIPVAHFEDAIKAAEHLGMHVVSLNTSSDDVTGKYVDLNAREHALEHTRSTYLAILSRARTIGATLSVQQRIDDIQQQIDQLHGQIKLLGNQASYSTLTVDVVPVGAKTLATVHHDRHGIGKAWHDSWSRFSRGVDALVGAIGPIVFAVLLIALLAGIGTLGYRGVRKVTGSHGAAV